MPTSDPTITEFSARDIARHLDGLAALLHASVHAGASIGFVLPFTPDEAAAFWTDKVAPPVEAGTRILFVARDEERIAGAIQLDHDTPANQPHRVEMRKLMVHPDFRRRGIARALAVALERRAVRLGRSLITLDTRTGDVAEPLYLSMGYRTAGVIPGYCRDPFEDTLDSTTIMYKVL